MNRSEFLKRLGLGIGAVVAAPSALAELKESHEIDTDIDESTDKKDELAFWKKDSNVCIPTTFTYLPFVF
jgi:hypothetical protein